MTLDEVMALLSGQSPEAKEELAAEIERSLGAQRFFPSPGPQTEAWFCPADLLLYGGAGSGGKTALLCGLALEQHVQSLLMRREYTALEGGGGVMDLLLNLAGTRNGFNGSSPPTFRFKGDRIVTFGAVKDPGDENKFNGRARDFLGLDEATQFQEQQVRHLMGWVRTTIPGQRTRTVLASNPPMSAEGLWVTGMFRPWLDITHPNPAKDGELRWHITTPNGDELEVDDDTPVQMGDQVLRPKSRTFIRAFFGDNPYIIKEDYQRELDAMPEPLRSQLRDGNFLAARPDDEYQIIPSEWVRLAQGRWSPEPPGHAPMTCLGVDVAQGGKDQTVLARRYDGWFAPLLTFPGKDTPDGPSVAGLVLSHRQHGAAVVIDMGGGYGGSAADHLKANGIDVVKFVPGGESRLSTKDFAYSFFNKRAETWWRFREALDPAQTDGPPIALPPDPDLAAELTAMTYSTGEKRVMKAEKKDDVKKRIGRSTDRADAVIMAWSAGGATPSHGRMWRGFSETRGAPKVVTGYADRRAKIRGR